MQKQDKAALKASFRIQIKAHPYLMLALLFLLICGITAGAATMEPLLSLRGNQYIAKCLLSSIHGFPLNVRSVVQLFLLDSSLFLFVLLAGIWIPGVIFTSIGIILKGFLLGACVCSFIWCWGIVGVTGALLTVLLPGGLTLLVIVSFSEKSFLQWADRAEEFFRGQYLPISAEYIKSFLHSGKALCLSMLIEYFFSAVGVLFFRLLFDAFLAG